MTDEMRAALVAVALGSGADVGAAWSVVDAVEAEGITDVRDVTAEVSRRAQARAWNGHAGIRG